MSAYLVLHGYENRRWTDHWQRHLVGELRAAGHLAIYPQLPNESSPSQSEWHDVVRTEFELLAEAGVTHVVVIAHSLSGLSMLALLEGYQPPVRISRLLLVAPADPDLIAEISDFRLDPSRTEVRDGLQRNVDEVTLIASEADEWLPRGVEATYAQPLGIEPVIFTGAGHIALGDGFGRWRGVIEWALDPSASLTRR